MDEPIEDRMMYDSELDVIRNELVRAMQLAEQGKHRQAVEVCGRCLKTAAQRSTPLPEGFTAALLTRMGLSMAAQNDWDEAIAHYHMAEGVLLRRKESIRKVRSRYHIAIYSTDHDLRLLLIDIYQALGNVYGVRDNWDQAITYLKQAYKLAQSVDNAGLAWRAVNAIALSYQTRGMWNDLQSAAERLLRINETEPQPTREILARRFLAQAYGKTGCLDDMLVELERIVNIGRSTGHPDLESDERALLRAQQAIVDHSTQSEPAQSLAIITVDPGRTSITPVPSTSIEAVPVVRRSSKPTQNIPTPAEATECPPDLIHGIGFETQVEHGTPECVFVLQTRYFEQAQTLLSLFRPTLLPINVDSMEQLGEEATKLPKGGRLYLEWSLHDLRPNELLHSSVIPPSIIPQMEAANRETGRINIVIEGRDGRFGKRKRQSIPALFEPYILDWSGMTGVVRYLRRRYTQRDGVLKEQQAQHLLTLLQITLKEGLQATGFYREMAFIHRLLENRDEATHFFREEILFSLNPDGIPGPHTVQSFRQLAEVYLEQGNRGLAQDAICSGLAVHPNSFDALIAGAKMMDDPTDALRYLGRAYRIRKDDPLWPDTIKETAERFDRTIQQIEQAISIVATQVDLTTRFPLDRAALTRLRII